MNALDRYGIKGAFFINGHRIHPRTAGGIENQAVLREMYKRGHFIGNHTFSHQDITTLDDDAWRGEVLQVQQQVQSITGRRPWIFRPPFGRGDGLSFSHLSRDGYTIIMWNMDPLDWKAKTATQLFARAKRVIEDNPDGGIFLMHDTNRNTVEVFPLIIEWLMDRNATRTALGKSTLDIVGIDQFIGIR